MKKNSHKTTLLNQSIGGIGLNLTECCFCFSLLSVFLPIKIYPVVFLLNTLLCIADQYLSEPNQVVSTKSLLQNPWFIALLAFTGYAFISFISTYKGEPFIASNIIKLGINILFFCTVLNWMNQRDNQALLKAIELTLFIALFLSFLQLLLYHKAFHFKLILGASSSNNASRLYLPTLFFWGLDDKNMFGARLALLGFAYLLISLARSQRLHWWRILWVFILGYLSLSRTPIVALLLGIFILVWSIAHKPLRIGLLIFSAAAIPFVAKKLIRVENLSSSNDGMGVRLNYWKTFFSHFGDISPLGEGFLKGGEFLRKNAPFYHGEPHIHNTFLSSYLELGIIGFLSYSLFLGYFYRFCWQKNPSSLFWLAAFLPLLAIMMILYSGYDNDIILYLLLIFLIGSTGKIDLNRIKLSI